MILIIRVIVKLTGELQCVRMNTAKRVKGQLVRWNFPSILNLSSPNTQQPKRN